MIYTTYDLHTKQREILNEALTKPVKIRRRGEVFILYAAPTPKIPSSPYETNTLGFPRDPGFKDEDIF